MEMEYISISTCNAEVGGGARYLQRGGVFHGIPFSPPGVLLGFYLEYSVRITFQMFLAGLCRNLWNRPCILAGEGCLERVGLIGWQ